VDFAFLSAEEIRTLSVKQIQNPTTFDTLLNPVPGGLYDPALGAWGDIQSVYGLKSAYLKLFH
jgi:DNA-directed RNA polymerase I subunit RPA1